MMTILGPGFPTHYQSCQRLPSHYTPLPLTNSKATIWRRIVALHQMTSAGRTESEACVHPVMTR